LLLLLSLSPADAETSGTDRESQDWSSLLEAAPGGEPVGKNLELFVQFLNIYPSGAHADEARFAIAETLFAEQRDTEAKPFYQALSERKGSPYSEDAILRLGEIAYNSQRYADAEKAWALAAGKISGRSPLLAEAWYGIALCQIQRQDYSAANGTLVRLLTRFPAYSQAGKVRELSGILRLKEKRSAESVKLLEGLDTPIAQYYRALGLYSGNRYLEAAGVFDQMQRASAGTPGEIAAYFKAECFRLARNDALAGATYDEILLQHPHGRFSPYALTQKAAFLLKTGDGDMEKAIRLLDEARTLAPEADNGLVQQLDLVKVYSLVQKEKWEEAASLMNDLLLTPPYSRMGMAAAVLSGKAAAVRGDWAAAVASEQTALLRNAYSPFSDVALGLLLTDRFQAHQYQDLVADANRIIQMFHTEASKQSFLWREYIHFLMGEAYYRLGNHAEAARQYEEALQAPALATQARLYMAWSLYHVKKHEAAVRSARTVLSSSDAPESWKGSAAFLVAASGFDQGDYRAALEAFAAFRRDHPQDPHVPEAWLQEGWAHWELGETDDALGSWEKMAAFFPEDPLAQEALLQVGQSYFQARQYAKAELVLSEFLSRWPSSRWAPEARWSLAQSYYNHEEFSKAMQEYQAFARGNPKDPRSSDAQSQLILSAFRQATKSGDPALLSQFVGDYPKSAQAPEAQYQLAHLHFVNGRWAQAVAELHKLLLDYPETVRAPAGFIEIAEAEEHLDDLASAQRDYRSLLQLLPSGPLAVNVRMRLGAVEFKAKKFAEAAADFRALMALEVSTATKADAAYNLAEALKEDRDYDNALKAWAQFIAAYPADPRRSDALLETASIYEAQRAPDKAAQVYAQATQDERMAPDKKAVLYNRLGDIALEKGDKQGALDAYGKLLALTTSSCDARLAGLAQLAALYEGKEYWRNALMIYRQIEQSGGRADWVQAAGRRGREVAQYLDALPARAASDEGKAPAAGGTPARLDTAAAAPPAPPSQPTSTGD
jgi:TolA-binding protein